MTDLTTIIAALDAEHPVIIDRINGADVELSPEARTARIQQWAEAQWQSQQLTPEQQLTAARAQMAAILDGLPLDVRAMLWPTRVAVEQALDRGHMDIARALVAAQPVSPELEPTKQEILDLFPA